MMFSSILTGTVLKNAYIYNSCIYNIYIIDD